MLTDASVETQRQGLELLRTYEDPALWDEVLSCTELRPDGTLAPPFERNGALKAAFFSHPSGEPCRRVTSLKAGSPSFEPYPLDRMTSLEALDLDASGKRPGDIVTPDDLPGLVGHPTLRAVSLTEETAARFLDVVVALPNLQSLALVVPHKFDLSTLGPLPKLRALKLKRQGEWPRTADIDLSLLGAPMLGRFESIGFAMLSGLRSRVGTPLSSFIVDGEIGVEDLDAVLELPLKEMSIGAWGSRRNLAQVRHVAVLASKDDRWRDQLTEWIPPDATKVTLSREVLGIQALRHRPSLVRLEIAEASKLEALDGLEHCLQLQSVVISQPDTIWWAPESESFTRTKADWVGENRLRNMDALAMLPALSGLCISGATRLDQYPNVTRLGKARDGSSNRRPHILLANRSAVVDFQLVLTAGMTDADALPRLRRLAELRRGLALLEPAGYEKVVVDPEVLDVSGSKLTDLRNFAGLEGIRRLVLDECPNLVDLSAALTMPDLRELSVGCSGNVDLETLAGASRLEVLALKECGSVVLRSLGASIDSLTALRHVDLSNNGFLDDIRVLQRCASLERISLARCGRMDSKTLSTARAIRKYFEKRAAGAGAGDAA
jgi:hypothetical protein